MRINKKMRLIGLKIIIGSIATGITTFLIIDSLHKEENFKLKIKNFMLEYDIPSLAVGIVNNETIVWSRGFGEQQELDIVYMIGSITKTFTATAILQLNETGLLHLSDDINLSIY